MIFNGKKLLRERLGERSTKNRRKALTDEMIFCG